MKKAILFTLLILVGLSLYPDEPNRYYMFNITTGYTLAWIKAPTYDLCRCHNFLYSEPFHSYNLSFSVISPEYFFLTLEPGVRYINRGKSLNQDLEAHLLFLRETTTLSYIDMFCKVKFNTHNRLAHFINLQIYPFMGVSYSYLVRAKTTRSVNLYDEIDGVFHRRHFTINPQKSADPHNKTSYFWSGGIDFRIMHRYMLTFEYNENISNIKSKASQNDKNARAVNISVGYLF
jgi:hypothetical protein